jgi:hypothetical protein
MPMRKILLALLLSGCAGPAFACTGGPITSINLTAPTNFVVDNASTCVSVTNAVSATVSPSTLATAVAAAGALSLTPLANGSGTLTISLAGYSNLSIPLTVTLGTLELDP